MIILAMVTFHDDTSFWGGKGKGFKGKLTADRLKTI